MFLAAWSLLSLLYVVLNLNVWVFTGLHALTNAVGVGLFLWYARSVRKRVADTRGLVCRNCNYELGDALIKQCPECGARFDANEPLL